MNITFYNEAVDSRIPEMQKRVFNKLGLEINQINPDIWHGHAGSIDRFLEDYDWKDGYIAIFDVDCIPLNQDAYVKAVLWALQNEGIYSIAQKPSHIPNSIIYASPAFIVFSKKTYEALGSPRFACTERSDCAGELTHKAREKGVEVRLLYPSHVEIPMWQLDGPVMFGKGTTFGKNDIYHAFYSRKGNVEPFLKKCEEVLKK